MKRKIAVLTALLMIFTVFAAAAGIPPAPTSGFVVDNAEVLDAATVTALNERGTETDQATGTAVVVVTTDYTGTYAIDEYCDAVFDEWEIEDGLVLVLAVSDEDYYAMPSAGLGRYLTTNRVQELLNSSLEPDFARGDYDAGVQKIYSAFCEEIETLYSQYGQAPTDNAPAQSGVTQQGQQAAPPVRSAASPKNGNIGLGDAVMVLIVAMILMLLFVGLMLRPRRRRTRGFFGGGYPPPPPPRRTFWGGFFGPGRYHRPTPPPPPPRHPPHGPGGFGGPGGPGGFGGPGAGGSAPRSGGGFSGGFGGGGSRGGGAGRSPGASRPSGAPRSSAPRGGAGRSGGSSFGGGSRGGGFGGGGGRGGGAGRGGGRH